jgi:FixJ family two-component response regulator
VVCADFYDKTAYIEAMSLGAYDYIASPYRQSEVEWIVGNAVRRISSARPARGPAHGQRTRVNLAHAAQDRTS